MQLKKLEFSEHLGSPNEWVLDKASFGQINLIVGKNSSGKTRLLNVINGLARVLRGRKDLWQSGNYKATFQDGASEYLYTLEINNYEVTSETYSVNDKQLLRRGENGEGSIYAVELAQEIKFQVPTNKVAATARQDSIQHPFLKPLSDWANSVRHYLFGSEFGKNRAILLQDLQSGEATDSEESDIDPQEVSKQYKKGFDKFGEAFDEAILRDMEILGYPCSDVGLGPAPVPLKSQPPVAFLFVQEKTLKGLTTQLTMSQGMFRALALTIQFNYTTLNNQENACILIDDIGEGLDFRRSTALIEMLVERCKQARIQLFMTTNDRFVMNGVPLEYWSIVNRNGNRVRLINKDNSEEKFSEFKYIGLSNFDFFSSEYYEDEKPDA